MPPAALVLVALLGLVAWAITRPSSSSDPAGGPEGAPDDSFTARVAGQGAQLLESLGQTVRKIWTPPAAAAPYLETIGQAENANGLPQGLLARLLYQESRYRPDIITGEISSPAGAIGIAQFMPRTAAELGVDPLDPHASIDAAAAYLKSLYDRLGSWTSAIAAYNWGIGNVTRKGLAAAPAETQKYVADIAGDVGLGS